MKLRTPARVLFVFLLLPGLLAASAWWVRSCAERRLDPQQILDAIVNPPSPVLSPEEGLAAMRIAPGFRVELVASEPLVVDPVWVDWDDAGRLYVAEMRGYMQNIDAEGEDDPIGRVVVLEDHDGDGAMDESRTYLDGLVLPRTVAVVPQGVLIAEPPNLWLCRDLNDGDGLPHCDEKTRIADFADRGTPEHSENGFVVGLDNWIYTAKSARRMRIHGEGPEARVERQPSVFRGQWGIAQDDFGRLFHNHNSEFILVDLFAGEVLHRHPATDPVRAPRPGMGEVLTAEDSVHSVRVNPGVNRAYLRGTLRADGRLARPTAVSGIAIQRSDRFGEDHRGDVFVPEIAGNAIAHFRIHEEGLHLRAEHRLYPDPEWEQREFLASTDERFRPVSVAVGPDGALTIVDMYRGIVQWGPFISDYLRDYIAEQSLEQPIGLGRIYRVVRDDLPDSPEPPAISTATPQQLVALLDHANGWWRERAQLALIAARDPGAVALLRELPGGPKAKLHALFTLGALAALDLETWLRGLDDPDPEVRVGALRAGATTLTAGVPEAARERILRALEDVSPRVRLHALFALGDLASDERPYEEMIAAQDRAQGGEDAAIFESALLSGIAGGELEMIRLLSAQLDQGPGPRGEAPNSAVLEPADLLAKVAKAQLVRLSTESDLAGIAAFLAWIDARPSAGVQLEQKLALLDGLAQAKQPLGLERPSLAVRPELFAQQALDSEGPLGDALRSARGVVTWEGDEYVEGVVPLSGEQRTRMEEGAELYAETCQNCHQAHGGGLDALAPSLIQSAWVMDSDDWLIRIVLHGLSGPIQVAGREWNGSMPGHSGNPRFAGDEVVAGLLTFVRRSFGNTGEAIEPQDVARVRTASAGRSSPWTAAELVELPTPHRFDRYAGRYRIPEVPLLRLAVSREGILLRASSTGMGDMTLESLPDGTFGVDVSGRGFIRMEFIEDESGEVNEMLMHREGGDIRWNRTE